ncbi:MAG TPA: glycoside hydrolase family 3 N-terminal domain-containing protein [Saprospiraceae bacterium]|nr:glycoside hydrolase family 3 N-terminal domain-containing protein [Saprospiraceae bacterium]HMQ84104.1 glycoside hydrolase family 3 N-terminal domain-containing protein [Saprospiraceae bacterium]
MFSKRLWVPCFLTLLGVCMSFYPAGKNQGTYYVSKDMHWADSVYQHMSLDERIGQLFMIRAHSDLGQDHIDQVKANIQRYHVGGLCFFQGTPEKQIELINEYQQLSEEIPLFIAIDGEWGLGMRMKSSTISFPRQLMLGAIQDNKMIYEMGKEIAWQMQRVGVNINFAPVADVNNNAANPVINTRSFGEDRYNVAVKSYMYMKGMQDNGVMACAKHFPGHGDTDVDSHKDLPVIAHDRQRLDSIELFPFKILAQQGVGSMMVAHMNVTAIDDRENRPTTLSYPTITELLKEELGYAGLVFTDAMDMKGLTNYYRGGTAEAEAFMAGNDMLLLPVDIGAAVEKIKQYMAEGKIGEDRLAESVKKVLAAKYRYNLTHFEAIPVENVQAELNHSGAIALRKELIAHALTLVRNPNDLIPFKNLEATKMASLSIGASAKTAFQERLLSYQKMPTLSVGSDISVQKQEELLQSLSKYDVVIVGLHDLKNSYDNDFGVSSSTRKFIHNLRQKTKVVLVVFGNPYSLKFFDEVDWVLEAYQNENEVQDIAAQALFGALPLRGRLPVTASPTSAYGTGVLTQKTYRFGYSEPRMMGVNDSLLAKIDEIAQNAVDLKATPGCVVLVAKDGQIIYEKAFGHHSYSEEIETDISDLYDVASVTKIAAATLAVMKLYDEGKVSLDTPIVRYIPELAGTNKENLILRDIMAHRAGLTDWIPFYKETLEYKKKKVIQKSDYLQKSAKGEFTVPITDHLFLRQDFVDTIWQRIYTSNLKPNKNYEYSDLGFYLIAKLVQNVSGSPLDEYVKANYYDPMGLESIGFNPWQHFDKDRIAPTEKDAYFRLQTVQGYVHDMGAAMLGGVSGHAGLFSDAKDMAALMQLLLNKGKYGEEQFISPETVDTFLQRHSRDSRRAMGFDMRELNPARYINLPLETSSGTFGHTGFTGTCAWADPQNQLVFVFLANRTYPSMNNYKLNRQETRRRIHSAIYQAIEADKASEMGYNGADATETVAHGK